MTRRSGARIVFQHYRCSQGHAWRVRVPDMQLMGEHIADIYAPAILAELEAHNTILEFLSR